MPFVADKWCDKTPAVGRTSDKIEKFDSGIVRVFNAQSLLLNHFEVLDQGILLPVGNLANGIYLLEVQLDGKPGTRKSFVVNR